MVREMVDFEAREEGFVQAYDGAAHVPNEADGSRGAPPPYRGVENPGTSTLTVKWNSVDTHAALTKKPGFEDFGDVIGPHLAGLPLVRHVEAVG